MKANSNSFVKQLLEKSKNYKCFMATCKTENINKQKKINLQKIKANFNSN